MTTRRQVESLYESLAAILNALDAAGEHPRPFSDRKTGYSGVLGDSGSVDADKDAGHWVVVMKSVDTHPGEDAIYAARQGVRDAWVAGNRPEEFSAALDRLVAAVREDERHRRAN